MKVITKTTPELVEYLEGVDEWCTGGLTMVPFFAHYALLAFGPLAARHAPGFEAPYACWYGPEGVGSEAGVEQGIIKRGQKRLLADPKLVKKLFADWRLHADKFMKVLNRGDINWQEDEAYEEFEEVYLVEYCRAAVGEFFLYGDHLLDEVIKQYGAEVVQQAVEPRGETFIKKYNVALTKCALGDLSPAEVVKDFHWVRNNYRDTDLVTEEVVEEERDELKKSFLDDELKEKVDSLTRDNSKEIVELLKDWREEERKLVDMFAFGGLWIDQRKELNLRANSVIGKYLQRQAEELGEPIEDFRYLIAEELKEILSGKKKISNFPIKERQKHCFSLHHGEVGTFWISGEEVKELEKYRPDHGKVVEDGEMAGQAAPAGKARGKVRVVLDPKNNGDFKEGDILVAYQTRPEYVPLMKKAGAIVTNEGGITSHAAIVSRELGIPCIIGTKIATQVLKDGDMVEVDANKGVVRKV